MILIFLILSQFCFFEPLQFFPLSIILQYYETSFILYANNCFLFLIRLIYIYIYIYISRTHLPNRSRDIFFCATLSSLLFKVCISWIWIQWSISHQFQWNGNFICISYQSHDFHSSIPSLHSATLPPSNKLLFKKNI